MEAGWKTRSWRSRKAPDEADASSRSDRSSSFATRLQRADAGVSGAVLPAVRLFSGGSHATLLVASFAGFALLAVAFFQFGVASPPSVSRPGALRARCRLRRGFALPAGVVRDAVRARVGGPGRADGRCDDRRSSSPLRWLRWSRVGARRAPFALLGIALGYWASPRGLAGGQHLTSSWRSPGALDDSRPFAVSRRFRLAARPDAAVRERVGRDGGRLWRPRTGCSFWRGARRSPRWLPGGIDATKGGLWLSVGEIGGSS
jgi:hypothetical protein